MPERTQGRDGRLRRLRRAVVMAATAWTLVVAASLGWNLYNTWGNAGELATREARAHFNKDQAVRYWASRHGGVYVEVDERTPPNPALSHLAERDLTTPSGRRLTLMNPAYMIRQIMTDYAELYGVRGRITSLQPLNPHNAPDPWEAAALHRFDAGEREVVEVADREGSPHLRMIRAMITEESCLKCHGDQGYRVGDVRGGVGVAVPLAPYYRMARAGMAIQAGTHGAIWLVGLGGIVLVGRRFRVQARLEMAEQARAESLNHKFDLVLRSVGDGIIGVDADGRITFVNAAGAALLGVEPDDLRDRPLHDAIHHTRADGSACDAETCPTLRALRDGGNHHRVADIFLRRDGTSLPVELVSSPAMDDDRVVGAVLVFRDVSERLAADRLSQDLMERLAQSNQDLQQFAYTVSHDLQEPLRMVSSYVQLIGRRLGGSMDEDCREFIGFAVEGAARMSRMIADLVEFSRVESRGGPLQRVSADQVVDDAVANLTLAIGEAAAEVVVVKPLPEVMGDPSQLVRLFQNLIGNAVKFRSPDRPCRVVVDAVRRDGMAEFRVADNGIGISADCFDRIFQIFQRLHGRSQYEGTGIGLAVVRRIAERHGGRVWVESRPGEGSVFHLSLPLASA